MVAAARIVYLGVYGSVGRINFIIELSEHHTTTPNPTQTTSLLEVKCTMAFRDALGNGGGEI